ncbi:MAG: response regulator [Candidatus Marinimicrobia bacterium]|nr:response regulator [Candidatus Neomarinimicrobiota bacterium]
MNNNSIESILEAFQHIHIITEKNGKIIDISDSVRSLLGYHPKEIQGKNLSEMTNKPDLKVLDSFLNLETGESNQGLIHLLDSQGKVVSCFIDIKKVEEESLPVLLILVTVIEHIELSFEKLHYEKQLFRLLMDNIPDLIYFKDKKSRFIDVSQSMTQVFGVKSIDEIIGKSDFDLHKPDHAQKAFADEQKIIQTGQPIINQLQEEIWQNNEKSYTLITKMPIRTESGEIIGTFGISKDITQLKKLEQKLAKSKNILKMLLDYSSERIYFKDTDHRFTLINKAHKDYLRLRDFDEIIGKSDLDLFPEQDVAEWHNTEDEIMKTGEPRSFEGQDILPNGERRWVLTSKAPLYDENGRISGIIGISRDITERKKHEEELEKAKLEAEQASRAKSYFLANMSHEIRTPMNGIMGMNSLLLETKLDEEQKNYALTVQKSADALLNVINDILDFSKIEAGKLELEQITFNIRSMLDDFAKTIAIKADEKGLEFICTAAPDVPFFAIGDPGRIRQILYNLTGNAIKFTEKGEVTVFCELENESTHEILLRFTVRDTGIGIPLKYQSKLFQSFSQADSSTTRKFGGTGLGLAISRQLSEIMGGSIGFSSIENQGTTFWFNIRLEKSDKVSAFNTPKDIAGTKILFVDDNKTNRDYIEKQLLYWNAIVKTVSNGGEAIVELHRAADERREYEIAILDMQMPGFDGVDLGKAIKNDTKIKNVPLVMMTSVGHRGEVRKLKEIGFSAYLTKPVSPSDLYNTLSMILGNSDSIQNNPEDLEIITKFSINERYRANIKVLVVEDNPVNQNVARGMLKNAGIDAVYIANNGKEALDQLGKYDFDLVLMDMQMPVLDGVSATKMIRSGQVKVKNPQVNIIAMTANAMKGAEEKCRVAGMNDYISKPIKLDTLKKTLARWLPKNDNSEAKETMMAVNYDGIFNMELMLENLGGDKSLVKEIIELFVDNTKENLDKLENFIEVQDFDNAALVAHSVKGSSGNITSDAMYKVALDLENFCKSKNLEKSKIEVEKLQSLFQWFLDNKDKF